MQMCWTTWLSSLPHCCSSKHRSLTQTVAAIRKLTKKLTTSIIFFTQNLPWCRVLTAHRPPFRTDSLCYVLSSLFSLSQYLSKSHSRVRVLLFFSSKKRSISRRLQHYGPWSRVLVVVATSYTFLLCVCALNYCTNYVTKCTFNHQLFLLMSGIC